MTTGCPVKPPDIHFTSHSQGIRPYALSAPDDDNMASKHNWAQPNDWPRRFKYE